MKPLERPPSFLGLLYCGVVMEIKIELDTHDASLLVAISSYCNIPIGTLVRYWVRRELATHMVK